MHRQSGVKSNRRVPIVFGALLLVFLGSFGILAFRDEQGTAFVGVLTVLVAGAGAYATYLTDRENRAQQAQLERESRIAEERREQKIRTYEGLIAVWLDMINGTDERKAEIRADPKSHLREPMEQLIPWASDEVLRAFARMRANEGHPLLLLADFLLAIRADLGHENRDITQQDVLRMFISGVSDEFMAELLSAGQIADGS